MEKLKLHSPNLTAVNIDKLASLFPNCVTEAKDEKTGLVKCAIDFDKLRHELADHLVDSPRERYHLDWPGKREALLTANAPIAKTLRPCREESVNFDTTKNLFIEGDNLDALKLLQETYLGKVKIIYIDPPYNTGNDFIYQDDFAVDSGTYLSKSNQVDDQGNRMEANTLTNGRFHSDWLSMMYSRLKLAQRLLHEEGAIFISIDEHEQPNLRRICDEIFGEQNFRNQLLVRRRVKSLNVQFSANGLSSLNVGFEYVLIYAKSDAFLMKALRMKKKQAPEKGSWNVFWSGADRPTMRYALLGFTPTSGQWRWAKDKAEEAVRNYETYTRDFSKSLSLEEYWEQKGGTLRFIRRIPDGEGKNGGVQYWVPPSETTLRTSNWTDIEVSQIQKQYDLPFSNPKNPELIKTIISLCSDRNAIIADFFAGSGTTAEAVMQSNAEDGGARRFILVQIPEKFDPQTENAKQYENIAEISKERIRLASKEFESPHIDSGFRVLKIATSNLKDVYYAPDSIKQDDLVGHTDNIKEDRTPEDLLFQVLVDWGVDLALPIERKTIAGKTVFFVDGNALAACFDVGVTEELIKTIAERKPLRAVFRDAGFASDSAKINMEQLFKLLSPATELRSI